MTIRTLEVEIRGSVDTSQLLARIQFEQACLRRDHVYYSVDEQPDICARLIAQGIKAKPKGKSNADDLWMVSRDGERVYLGGEGIPMNQAQEWFTGRRMHTTVTNWDAAELAIKRMCDRWRELKREGAR